MYVEDKVAIGLLLIGAIGACTIIVVDGDNNYTKQSNESDVVGREQDTPMADKLFKKKNKK